MDERRPTNYNSIQKNMRSVRVLNKSTSVHILIVLFEASHPCDSLCVFIVLLLRLARPREEKTTRRSVLKTIACGATVETKLALNGARQTRNTHLLKPVATIGLISDCACDVRPCHLRDYSCHLCVVIDMT